MDEIESEAAYNGHVEAEVVIVRPDELSHKQKHKTKYALIDEKRSRRNLERTIIDLQRKLARQEHIISSLQRSTCNIAVANTAAANITTSNRFDAIMPFEDNDEQVSHDLLANNAPLPPQSPKLKLTRQTSAVSDSNTHTSQNINVSQASTKRSPTAPASSNPKRAKIASTQKSVPAQTAKEHKPPPIVVSHLDCKLIASLLSNSIGNDAFSFRHVGKNTTNINTKKLSDYKAVLSLLADSDAQHHTFTPKEEQHINIVLRHLDSSYNDTDIKEALEILALDIIVSKIMPLPTQTNNHLWLIQLQAGSDAKQLLNQNYLLHQKVVFERKRQGNISQCKNCQLLGHSARNCKHKFRCVKCTSDHGPGQCPRTLDPNIANETSPSCVNCNADHPANYRGCPYYAKIIERKQAQRQQQHTVQQNKTVQNPRYALRSEQISYAAALASPAQPTVQTQNPIDFLNAECNKYFNLDITMLHSKLKLFYPKYVALDEDKRAIALLGFTMTLSS